MIEWIALGVNYVNRETAAGKPVRLCRRTLLGRVTADNLQLARAAAPAGTKKIISVASLRVHDPEGWLGRPYGSYRDTAEEAR